MFENEYDILTYYKKLYDKNIYKTGIYKIWFIKNPEYFYIGMASQINKFNCNSGFYSRWKRHINDFKCKRHKNTFMQNLYNKYTYNDLRFEIIEYCESEKCIINELKWFNKLKPPTNFQGNKYNIKEECKPIGIINRKIRKNFKHSDETKIKIGIANKNNKNGLKQISQKELDDIIYNINNGETLNYVCKKYKHERIHLYNELISYINLDVFNILKKKSYENGRNKIKTSLNKNKKTVSEKYHDIIKQCIELYENKKTIKEISKTLKVNSDYISIILKENMNYDDYIKIKNENYNRRKNE